uniref:Uncharacterized protein n=1 Tax=Cacopsylla melanoneura TaxID=428564 RepID=A0A8D8WKD7_9HEMI
MKPQDIMYPIHSSLRLSLILCNERMTCLVTDILPVTHSMLNRSFYHRTKIQEIGTKGMNNQIKISQHFQIITNHHHQKKKIRVALKLTSLLMIWTTYPTVQRELEM